MIEYQTNRLKRFQYERDNNDMYCDFRKTIQLDGFNIMSLITVNLQDDPDAISYNGLVTLIDPKTMTVIGEWDAGMRYKLLDTITNCERIIRLVTAINNHLTNKTD